MQIIKNQLFCSWSCQVIIVVTYILWLMATDTLLFMLIMCPWILILGMGKASLAPS